MRQYLTKVDTREGRYACAKEDANAQGQISARAGAVAVRGTAKGELRTGNYVDVNRWELSNVGSDW